MSPYYSVIINKTIIKIRDSHVADTYEIQVKSGSRWSLHSYKPTEGQAVKEARKLLQQRVCDQAQVIFKGSKGETKTVFDEDQESVKKKASLGNISSSPVFKSLNDLYTPAALQTMGQLLRDYCDQKTHSIRELLHNHRAMEQFEDDSLCASALDKLAELQAVKAQANQAKWREHLFDLLAEAKEKARSSGFDDIANGTLNTHIAELGSIEDADILYRLNLSVTKKTMLSPSWEGKFSVLFDLVGDVEPEALDKKCADYLDSFIAELFMVQEVIIEMLGQQPDRFNAIDVMVKMCTGRYEARKWDTPALKNISLLMSKLPMSKCRSTLANRIEQMLRSRSSLTKGDIHEEKHAFKELLPQFIAKNGSILGGEGMAEALAMCGTRSFSRDRNLDNPAEAIHYIMETLSVPILQLRFLLILSKSQFGRDCKGIVCEFLPTFMEGPEHVHDIVHYKLPLAKKLKTITGLQKAALEIELPKNMQVTFSDWLDDMLYNYLNEERIIDKMDSPEETLFKRATALLQFCASGILIEGKTLSWVRERVQDHLRQPNFVEKFTEDVETPKKKELVITQLHAMLKKAGLQQ
jgi:hypothetical protein